MDYSVDRKRIRCSCNGCSSSLKPSIKVLNACSILFENTHKKVCQENEMHVDQLARNTFRYLSSCSFSQNLPSFSEKQTLATLIQKLIQLALCSNKLYFEHETRIFVGDAIPMKELDITLERITLNFSINIW